MAFETRELRDLCSTEVDAIAVLGNEAAVQLKNRLADLEQCAHLFDLVVGEPEIVSDDPPCASLKIGASHVMKLVPNHLHCPLVDSRVDWSRVTRVKIVAIETRG